MLFIFFIITCNKTSIIIVECLEIDTVSQNRLKTIKIKKFD